jgi:hypothetical protein
VAGWWEWELAFTGHVERRMEERSFTEVELRSMLQRARGYARSAVQNRFMIETTHQGRLGSSSWNPTPTSVYSWSSRPTSLRDDRAISASHLP